MCEDWRTSTFENDVKAEGTKPVHARVHLDLPFENDVKAEATKRL